MKNKRFLKNKPRKIAAGAAALMAVLSLLTGCARVQFVAQMSDETLLIVNDEECTMAEGIFRLMEVKDEYISDEEEDELFWERSVGDITMEEYIKESVEEEMIRITSCIIMADEMAITISSEELEEITAAAEKSYASVSENHDLAAYGITLDSVIALYTKQELYDKIFDELSSDVDIQISESDTKVIEVNYAEIPLETDSDVLEALRQEVQAGTDFETACNEYGLEAIMNQVLKKGSMPDEFESVAYALVDGELSEIIETDECYYLIQCVEDYLISESVANNNKVMADARQETFNEAYTEFSAETSLQFNDAAWEEISVPEI